MRFIFTYDSSFYIANFACIIDTVASTVHSTVDTTKNAAASVIDKGASLVGGAKGINYVINYK